MASLLSLRSGEKRLPALHVRLFCTSDPCFRARPEPSGPHPAGFRLPSSHPVQPLKAAPLRERTDPRGLPSAGLRAPPAGAASCSAFGTSPEDAPSKSRTMGLYAMANDRSIVLEYILSGDERRAFEPEIQGRPRNPHSAERNAGLSAARLVPDFATLHPGYALSPDVRKSQRRWPYRSRVAPGGHLTSPSTAPYT